MSQEISHFPKDKYTPYYCEENILLLCQSDPSIYAVFISTEDEKTLLFHQRAGQKNMFSMVLWDYHVVALREKSEGNFIVYDYDSMLGLENDFAEWFQHTVLFPTFLEGPGAESMRAFMDNIRFRLVKGQDFVDHFASDRSHMLDAQGNFLKPPPLWDCPRGAKATCDTNLNHFRMMNPLENEDDIVVPGEILNIQELMQRFQNKEEDEGQNDNDQ
mmetsp:Transcript_5642/g.21244  ORF Transcript_5642/g.21244 Transcript_5642/m.21244 type:complete len:216 (-) Transcript_5642:1715-2362(-)